MQDVIQKLEGGTQMGPMFAILQNMIKKMEEKDVLSVSNKLVEVATEALKRNSSDHEVWLFLANLVAVVVTAIEIHMSTLGPLVIQSLAQPNCLTYEFLGDFSRAIRMRENYAHV